MYTMRRYEVRDIHMYNEAEKNYMFPITPLKEIGFKGMDFYAILLFL